MKRTTRSRVPSKSAAISSGVAAGLYYVIARADADIAVAEALETNNTLAKAVQVGSDLIVSTLSTSAATVAAGSSIVVSETVTNQGAGTAGPTTTRFHL